MRTALDANGNRRPRMRIVQVIGALLIAGGLYVLVKSPTYSSDKSLFKVGQVEARVREDHEIPPWAGGAGVAVGLVLVVAGARRGTG
jgi:drug/metabolite transporter (DMT)-like permease